MRVVMIFLVRSAKAEQAYLSTQSCEYDAVFYYDSDIITPSAYVNTVGWVVVDIYMYI